MQFAITDDAAIIFAKELYGAIADGYPLEAALAEARGAMRNEGNPTEWSTPVLYSRAPDGRLFNLTSMDRTSQAGRLAQEEADRLAQEEADRLAQERTTLGVLEGQARSTMEAGDAATARDQFAALLPVVERVLGAEHPDTLKIRADLADVEKRSRAKWWKWK